MGQRAMRSRLRAGLLGMGLAAATLLLAAQAGANLGGINPGAGTCACTQNGNSVPCVTPGATCTYRGKAGICKNKTLGIIGNTYCECEVPPPPKKGESTKTSAVADVPLQPVCAGTYNFTIFPTPEQKLIAFFPEELGYGQGVELTQFDGDFTIDIGPTGDPNVCSLQVTAGTGSAPPFQAGPLSTGPNLFTFGDPAQSSGQVDLLTSEFTVQAVGTITNDIFPEGIPVDGFYEGTVDLVGNTITFHSVSIDTYPVYKPAPALGVWALALCTVALVALAAVWLRRPRAIGSS